VIKGLDAVSPLAPVESMCCEMGTFCIPQAIDECQTQKPQGGKPRKSLKLQNSARLILDLMGLVESRICVGMKLGFSSFQDRKLIFRELN
jgi:hypothetical protein